MRPATVVLIGPMGAGKTSIGRKTAKVLGADFIDTDIAIARAHGPIPEIFEREGEDAFRRYERAAVVDALTRGGVVALGGGAILDADTRTDLASIPVVLLSVDRRTVARRIHGTNRPLLAGGHDPLERWDAVATERAPLYAQLADVTVDTSTGPIRDVVETVVAWIRTRWTDAGASAPQEGEQ